MPQAEGKTKAKPPVMLCLGYGYVAQALAQALSGQGWRIVGTRRDPGQSAPDAPVTLLPFAGTAGPDLLRTASQAAAVLVSIPPGEGGCPAFPALHEVFAANPPGWIGYLSTTGVYGDRAGRWAFEDDAPTPQSPEAGRRVQAEAQWRRLAPPAIVFRLPGIYGPSRSPLDRLRIGAERRIHKPGQVFSRAHVDDIAAALAASIARPNPGRVYNVCDDEPAPAHEVAAFAAALLGQAPPPLVPFAQADLSPMAQRFYSECKRVSNARLKAELGWRPAYPTYREGLAAILQAETSSTS